jgi:hypothetical protein
MSLLPVKTATATILFETCTAFRDVTPCYFISLLFAGFEVLSAVIMKIMIIFWDITPCSPLKVNMFFHNFR